MNAALGSTICFQAPIEVVSIVHTGEKEYKDRRSTKRGAYRLLCLGFLYLGGFPSHQVNHGR